MLAALPSSSRGGVSDYPLPTFSDGNPAVLVTIIPAVVKNNNTETAVICTNLATGAADVGLEVFDEAGVRGNTIATGNGAQLTVAPGQTVTITTGRAVVLHEDTLITLEAPVTGLSNGSGRVVATRARLECVALAVDKLHTIQDPAVCPTCQPPSFATLPMSAPCSPATCDDGNACTLDACDSNGACMYTPVTGCSTTTSSSTTSTSGTTSSSTTSVGASTSSTTSTTATSSTMLLSSTTSASPTTSTSTTGVAVNTSSTTTTVPSCLPEAPGGCDDSDPCTVDRCVPVAGCMSDPVTGFDAVGCVCVRGLEQRTCVGQPVPAGVAHRFQRACRLIARAAGTSKPRRVKRLLNGAVRTLGKARRLVTDADQNGKISTDCRAALGAALEDARRRAVGFAASVP